MTIRWKTCAQHHCAITMSVTDSSTSLLSSLDAATWCGPWSVVNTDTLPWFPTAHAVDRYTCPQATFHDMCSLAPGARRAQGAQRLKLRPKKGQSSTRHVSPCASQYTEHQHKFSLTYLSCVTVVLFSEPRLVVHASIYPP